MSWFPIRIIRDKTRIRFLHYRYIGFAFSLLVIFGTVGLIASRGLNLGIDFTGGVLMELRTQNQADIGAMRALLPASSFGEVSLQTFGKENEILLRIQAKDENQAIVAEHVKNTLNQSFGGIEYRRVEYVGPTVGKELLSSGVWSLCLAMVGMMLYLWFRFEWQYGVGGILALIHDAVGVFGFYAVTHLEFSLTSIAAILTIIGYSINDSVVIYDRIRENLRKYKKMPLEEVLDLSVNETLSRTIMTGGTVFLSVVALVLFGGEVIHAFSLAIGFGVLIGTYSSIYISANVLIYLKLRDEKSETKVIVKPA